VPYHNFFFFEPISIHLFLKKFAFQFPNLSKYCCSHSQLYWDYPFVFWFFPLIIGPKLDVALCYVLLKLDEGGVGQYDSTIYLQNFELFLLLFFIYIFRLFWCAILKNKKIILIYFQIKNTFKRNFLPYS